MAQYSEQDIRDALSHIPSDHRPLWVDMGYCIFDGLGEVAGWAVFDDWSKTSDAYVESHARAVWKSCCKPGPKKIGSLFYEARRHGYQGNPTPSELTPEQVAAQKARRERDEAELRQRMRAAREKRDHIMGRLELGISPYLRRKGFQENDALAFLYKGITVLPYRHAKGWVQTLQFIDDEGGKRFCANLPFAGSFARIGSRTPKMTVICEGYATAKSLHVALPEAQVLVAGSAHNAMLVSQQFPQAVIGADSDPVGVSYARKSKRPWVTPEREGLDFNDEWQIANRNGSLAEWIEVTRMKFHGI